MKTHHERKDMLDIIVKQYNLLAICGWCSAAIALAGLILQYFSPSMPGFICSAVALVCAGFVITNAGPLRTVRRINLRADAANNEATPVSQENMDIFVTSILLFGPQMATHTMHSTRVDGYNKAIAKAVGEAKQLKPNFEIGEVMCLNISTGGNVILNGTEVKEMLRQFE